MHSYAVKPQLIGLVRRGKRLASLLAAPAIVLLSQGEAKAVLNYYIFESEGNVILRGSGSLSLPGVIYTIPSIICGSYQPGADGSLCAGDSGGPSGTSINLYRTVSIVSSLPGTLPTGITEVSTNNINGDCGRNWP
jgi:hypothetical protein